MKKILITGTAGFIGMHVAKRLLDEGNEVVGLDNINNYYDVDLKYARLKENGISQKEILYGKLLLSYKYPLYNYIKLNLEDNENLSRLFEKEKFDIVIHMAAQAGVRYSIENPFIYIDSNVKGFINILESCRHYNIKHLIYASTSSVYGLNSKLPLSTHNAAEHPISLYAATKKANEMMAHTYSHLYRLPTTGLRFFTVYGPWGRPDMALFLFTKAILEGRPINVFNNGKMLRDFTYIEDIVESITRVCFKPATQNMEWDGKQPDPASSSCPYRIFNIGNSQPVELINYIEVLESILGKKAIKNFMPLQPGDILETHADTCDLTNWIGFRPQTTIYYGIEKFAEWYLRYYN